MKKSFLVSILVSVLFSVNAQKLNKEATKLRENNISAFTGIFEFVKATELNVDINIVNEQAFARELVVEFKHISNDELFAAISTHALQPQQFESKFIAMQTATNWVEVRNDLKVLELERKLSKMDKNTKEIFSGKKANNTADILTGAGFGVVIVGSIAAAPAVAVVGSLALTTGFIISRVAAHKTSNAIIDMME